MTSLATSTPNRLRGSDFLDIADFDPEELRAVVGLARRIKGGDWAERPLESRSIAMLFQKPSMRTRVSFHVGIERLGGRAITLGDQEIGLGHRESFPDIGRVLDRYVDGLVARLFSHQDLLDLAEASVKPVINALTDASHPCQILADVMTMEEHLGRLDGSTRVAFVGDGNNVVASLMEAATLLGFPLTVVSPPAYQPSAGAVARSRGVEVTTDLSAVEGASIVYTDVWTSMGHEAEAKARRREFAEYRVDEAVMGMAPEALFMHCLPAHRGEEVTAGVIDGPRSLVFDQAGNRLYAQMALMAAIFD